MANTSILVRDAKTGLTLALKAVDNGDGTYTLGVGSGDASQATLLTVNDLVSLTKAGRKQVKATTIDLNQAAASYTLFTGTTQVMLVESLVIRITNATAGTLTSISIQTDDTTPQVLVSAVQGASANLTAQAQLAWTGSIYLAVGKKIQLTIGGGSSGSANVCNVVATGRAVVDGGNLA